MRAIGNSGARSSGPTGWWVPGCSGGGGGDGRSGMTLYHCVGSSDSSSRILVGVWPVMGANVVRAPFGPGRDGDRYGHGPMGNPTTVPLVHGPHDVTAEWCDIALADRLDGA